jgi:hypothetical protein
MCHLQPSGAPLHPASKPRLKTKQTHLFELPPPPIPDANDAVSKLSKFDWIKCRGNTLEEVLRVFNRSPEPFSDMAASGRPSATSPHQQPVYHFIPDISLYTEAIKKGETVYYHKHGIRYAEFQFI